MVHRHSTCPALRQAERALHEPDIAPNRAVRIRSSASTVRAERSRLTDRRNERPQRQALFAGHARKVVGGDVRALDDGEQPAARVRGQFSSRLPVEQLAVVFATSLFGMCARMPPGEVLRGSCEAWVDLVVRGLESNTAGSPGDVPQ